MRLTGCLRALSVALGVVVLAAGVTLAAAAIAVAAPFTSPDGLWTWSRPLPHGYPGSSISTPAAGQLFVATTVPDVLVAQDSGASWSWSRTSSVADFGGPDGVAFVSPQSGWAWGSDINGAAGMVLRTKDGGATWQLAFTVPDRPALRAWFSGQAGWVVAGPVEEFRDLVVYSTRNGGATWSAPQPIPQTDSTTFAALAPQGGQDAVLMEKVWSRGAGSGSVLATKAWRTTDGGATWLAPVSLKGASIVDVAFSSSTIGWATGSAWLWGTTDGGASWHKVHAAPPSAHLATVGSDVWAISTWALHTADGGATWQSRADVSGYDIAFSDPADGWIARLATYYHTKDGGKTWQRITALRKAGVDKLAATSTATVWAAAGRVLRSTDAGGHWKTVSRRAATAVAAVSARQAWAVGSKGLVIHTIDGGRHWTRQTSGVSVDLNDVVFVDARHGWAGGEGGTFLRTTNGGARWTVKRVAVGAGIRRLAFADTKHGIAVPEALRPAILHTADGGLTWHIAHLPVAGDRATTVTMTDATHAVVLSFTAVGDVTHSWATSDGGRSWQQSGDVPGKGYYLSVAASGARLCAVDIGGKVATSTDGGATWKAAGAPCGDVMTSVTFVGAGRLLIGGELGILTRDLAAAPLP